MLVDALDRRGHVCLGVHAADVALDIVTTFRPDVVLLEWNLENGEGLDLVRRIRAQAGSVTIIVLTARELPDDFEHDSIDACVMKPAPIEVIERLLEPEAN